MVDSSKNELTVYVPIDLKFVDNMWTCTQSSSAMGMSTCTYDIKMTTDELKFVIAHELNHYLNGDMTGLATIRNVYYGFSTNPILLMLLSRYSLKIVGGMIVGNHLLSYYYQSIEKRADLSAIKFAPELKDAGKLFFENQLASKPRGTFSTFTKFLNKSIYYVYCFIGGRTHPTNEQRINYLS